MVVLFGLLVFVAAVGGAVGLGMVKSQVSQIPRVSVGLSLDLVGAPVNLVGASEGTSVDSAEQPGAEALNFLLVGIDNAAGIDPDSPIHIDRDVNSLLTDSVILVRIDPEADRVAMLSIPRDLWVPIADRGWSERMANNRSQSG